MRRHRHTSKADTNGDAKQNLLEWSEDQPPANYSGRPNFEGLCGKCEHLLLVETRFGRKFASCSQLSKFRLNPDDPVVNCSLFWPRGAKNLTEMIEEATAIVVLERHGQYL